jgi:hypothetical protein
MFAGQARYHLSYISSTQIYFLQQNSYRKRTHTIIIYWGLSVEQFSKGLQIKWTPPLPHSYSGLFSCVLTSPFLTWARVEVKKVASYKDKRKKLCH